jgi:hypothetical protein
MKNSRELKLKLLVLLPGGRTRAGGVLDSLAGST